VSTVDRVREGLPRVAPAEAALWAALVVAELLAVALYYAQPGVALTSLGALRYPLYGLIWVNVGLAVLVYADVPATSTRTRRRAAAVAVGYLAALAVAGGLVGLAAGPGAGLRIAPLPPGWGPAVLYSGGGLSVVLMPARVVGYLALAYLVYATVIDASGAGVAGLLGLLSCVSCSWPVLAALVSGVAGSGSALAATTLGLSQDLSTVVFLLTVGLLYWRPTIGG
jgi:hypothetical protein